MSTENLLTSAERIDIPARQLTGTREEKLRQLDEFLVQLQAVRLALTGAVPVSRPAS